MTASLCMNCGAIKQGAFCDCPECDSEPFDYEVAMALSEHTLTDWELQHVSSAIKMIAKTQYDEETRIVALLYFLSRKWPKLLEFDIESVDEAHQRSLEKLYEEKLKHLPGQKDPSIRVSPITVSHWGEAVTREFQVEEDAWKTQVPDLLLEGLLIAKDIVSLKIRSGEGAVLQRIRHRFLSLVSSPDYREMAADAEQHVGDATAYQWRVNHFGKQVKNGWSQQTQYQMDCFRGFCMRLTEMAEYNEQLIKHKAGIIPIISLEVQRLRQSLNMSYKTLIELYIAVSRPERNMPHSVGER